MPGCFFLLVECARIHFIHTIKWVQIGNLSSTENNKHFYLNRYKKASMASKCEPCALSLFPIALREWAPLVYPGNSTSGVAVRRCSRCCCPRYICGTEDMGNSHCRTCHVFRILPLFQLNLRTWSTRLCTLYTAHPLPPYMSYSIWFCSPRSDPYHARMCHRNTWSIYLKCRHHKA